MICTWGTWSISFLKYLSLNHFSQHANETLQETNDPIGLKTLVCLVKLVQLRYKVCSQFRTFRLPCWSQERIELFITALPATSSDNSNLVQFCLVTCIKKLEVAFVNDEFLHKKINNKDFCGLWCYSIYPRKSS